MNRSVMGRQMFANGGPAVAEMDPMMMQGAAPEMDPMMMQGAAPEMDPMMQGTVAAAQEQVDPNVLAAVFGQMEDQVTGIEGAEDIEGMINAVRGDEQPIEARRAELAGLVGPEDAEATPDSVLALVQPVVQLAAVDQGIGALAAEDMGAVSMEGPMSEGIMSTVDTAMPAEQVMVEPPMEMGVGNQPPVNFNQGGAVRPVQYYQPGGEVIGGVNFTPQDFFGPRIGIAPQQSLALRAIMDSSEERTAGQDDLREFVEESADIYREYGLGDAESRAADLEEQKRLSRSQMLFDIANTALAFAAPMEGERSGMSAAERLAMAASSTKLPQTIGARAQQQLEYEKEADKEERAITLAALQSGETKLAAQRAAQAKLAEIDAETKQAERLAEKKQYTFIRPITFQGRPYPQGGSAFLSSADVNKLQDIFGLDIVEAYKAPITDVDYFNKFGMPKDKFESLPEQDQKLLQGLPVVTDSDYFDKFGMDKASFLALPQQSRSNLLGIAPEYELKEIDDGEKITIVRINKNDPNETPVDIYSAEAFSEPDYYRVSLPSADGTVTKTIADLSTPEGKKLLEEVNRVNKEQGGGANLQKIATESTTPVQVLVPVRSADGQEIGREMFISNDNGLTYVGYDGAIKSVPSGSHIINSTQTYNVARQERIRRESVEFLARKDEELSPGMTFGTDATFKGSSLADDEETTRKDRILVKDSLLAIRNGTGTWSSIYAGINNVLGGLVAPEYFAQLFKDTTEGRQFTRLVYVLGRSALATSPRFAVADLETTGTLFPNTADFFANPDTEARKLVSLMQAVNEEEGRLHRIRASGTTIDAAFNAVITQKLSEIGRLKQLIGPIVGTAQRASARDLSGAQEVFDLKVKNRGK
jgi:hypothetical protein